MAKNKLTSKGKLKSKDKKGGKKNITLNSTLNKKSKPKQVSNPNIKKSNKVDSRKSNLNLKSESKNLSLKTKPLKFSLNKSLLALSIIIIFAIILVISFLVINNNSNIFPNLSQGKANKIIDVSSDMPESVVDQSMVVSSPVVSPASGNYFSSVGVSMTSETANAMIYYTTDSSVPTEQSNLYTGPFSLTSTTTIKAKAFKSGMTPSSVVTNTYTITSPAVVSSPVVSPASGSYFSSVGVSMTSETANAMIYYTTDSSVPTEQSNLYTGPFSLTSTTTIKAKAFKSGMTPSSVVTNTYTITSPAVVSSPVVSPASGNYFSSVGVSMTSETANAMIYYTTDSSVPTEQSNLYTGPFSLTSTTTIKAKAFKSGMTPSSVISNMYTITQPQVQLPTPIINIPSPPYYGHPYASISVPGHQDANIYYRSCYQNEFTKYIEPIRLCYNGDIYTKATKNGYIDSNINSQSYNVVCPNQVDFNVPSGNYSNPIQISMDVPNFKHTGIYYTLDGSNPNWRNSNLYTNPITLNSDGNYTLKAIAYYFCYNPAQITTANYIINLNSEVVTSPVFNPDSGTYESSVTISLSNSTSGSNIYYTTNGSTPTESSTLYSSPFTLISSKTVKARAYKTGMTPSSVVTNTYTITSPAVVSSPVVSPASGSYFSSVGVSMTSETANAMIYYTTDSSVPTEQSNLYTGPFSLTSTTTIKAKAFKSGMTPSSVVTNTYTITSPAVVSSPVVSPASGNYFSSVGVSMTSETANAMIYYTTDSSVPTEQSNLYTGPFSLTSTTTIKAKAFKSGMTPSSVVTRNYSITDSISPPVASPISGVYNNDIKVTLTNENLIGDIYYTIDGNDPKPTQEGTILYESPFTVNKKTLVRSQIFTKDKNSQILQNIYDFEVAKVVANKNSGTYTSKIDVSLSTDTLDATIYYSFDNSSPDKNSTLYTSPINISSSKNLYAVAYKEDYKDSNISIYNYTINLNSSPPGGGGSGGGSGGGGSPPPTYTIATPQASVLSGNYTTPITVTLSCETLGSSVYYTTDGTTPDKNKSLFTTPIFLDKNTNLKIRCYKLSLGYSDVVNYNYTFLLPEIVIPEPITKQTLETTLILIHQDKTTMIYSLQNLNKNTYSSDVLFSLEGVSLSKLNIFANDLLDSNISVSKAEQTDYNLELKYLDKVYSTFVIDLTNKDKINRTELEFSVSRKWLEENNLSPKDIISYYVINDQEMLLRLKHTESTEENRIYSLDITPLSGTIIIGSQTQEYKAMTSKQKILGFILLGVIIINIILIILLILKITKKKKEPKDKKDSQEKYFQEKDLRKQQILDDIKNNNLQEKTNPSKNIKIFNSKDFEKANDSKNDSKKETSDFERYKNEKLY